MDWFVYLVECNDMTLYCGVTNNIEKRLLAHNLGKGAKYTRCRIPVELVYKKSVATKSEALKLEYKIKKMPKKKKLNLINKLPEN